MNNTVNNDLSDNLIHFENNYGNPLNRISYEFSNFPLIKEENQLSIIQLLNSNVTEFLFQGISLKHIEDILPDSQINIIPNDVKQYMFDGFNSIQLKMMLDKYKSNWFYFYFLAMSTIKKVNYMHGKSTNPIKSLNDLKFDYIDINFYDNYGKLKLLQSIRIKNLFLNKLGFLSLDQLDTNTKFEIGFIYESIEFNHDKLEIDKEIFENNINKNNIH